MNYAHTITVSLPYEDAIALTKQELANQGFGVLTEIDIRATFTTKLGAESADAVGDYLILGACNPPLAEQALAADPNLGLLLPCNVVIRRSQSAETTTVQAINPQTMVQLSDVAAVKGVADQADERLRAALAAIEGASSN